MTCSETPLLERATTSSRVTADAGAGTQPQDEPDEQKPAHDEIRATPSPVEAADLLGFYASATALSPGHIHWEWTVARMG